MLVVSIVLFIERRKAGYCAVIWMVVLLLVCVLPLAEMLAAYVGGENEWVAWTFRIAFFTIVATLVYLTIRLLLSWDGGRTVYLLLASASVALLFATKETAFITLGTMAIACVSVFVWRRLRQSSTFRNNWFGAIFGLHAVIVAAALYYRNLLMDGGKWLYDNFLGEGKVHEAFVFYSILFLVAAALAAWFIFLSDLRRSNDSAFAEPVDLTWSNFRSGLGDRCRPDIGDRLYLDTFHIHHCRLFLFILYLC